MPFLQVLQKRYKNIEEVLIIGAVRHPRGNAKIITEYVKSKKVPDLQIYQHFQPDDLGVVTDVKDWGLHGPWFAVIGPAGKIVIHSTNGRKAASSILRLLKLAPVKSKMFPGLSIQHNKEIVNSYNEGTGIRNLLNRIEGVSKRDSPHGEEAKKMLVAFDLWRNTKISFIKSILARKPIRAYREIFQFNKIVYGLEDGDLFIEDYKVLSKNSVVLNGVRILAEIDKLDGISSSIARSRKVQSLLSRVKGFLDKEMDESLYDEFKFMMKVLVDYSE